ncbi:hypothetical protein AKJ09_11511 [Labilithrix luteola]|uniref:Lipoprotein n=1 Tax=Labilithrix luteola TaxID=1391654 RepID=A0A0K1QGK1_9BACT|nr:hypothetical protein [Labilithrix luteola]AKU93365.1 hypothetical protein AKJ09_00029 [Labilithrix luteola]AKV04848.1 hypothetical protein AKJ09_11511 [Labilithrix luteola]
MKRLMFIASLFALAACGAVFTPADRAKVVSDQRQIDACEDVARACQKTVCDGGTPCPECFKPYNDCLTDAGLQ